MLDAMSEPTTSEPATTPVVTPPAPQPRNRLHTVAAWVGIVAGVVFIVAVVFFSGFVLGAHTGGHRGWGPGDRAAIVHRDGPPGMYGPMMPGGPRGQFGPGQGPGFGPQQPPQPPESPQSPTTTAPARP